MATTPYNLPPQTNSDAVNIKTFFAVNSKTPYSFTANEIDATTSFFLKRGFDQISSNSIAIILLTQARNENVQVFTLLDTLKVLTDIQLSQVVAQVLNTNRDITSFIGYRTQPVTNTYEARNILV
jgi:hypothetical protein